MSKGRIVTVVFLFVFLSSFSFALEIKLNADKVLYYPEKDLMEAVGNVTLLWGGRKATADKGWVNFKSRDAFLEGNVVIEDERGTLRAFKVSFDAASETYLAEEKVVLVTKEGVRLECGKLEAKGKSRFRAYEKPKIVKNGAVLIAEEIVYENGEAKVKLPKYEDSEKKLYIASSSAKVVFGGDGKIKTILCSGSVSVKHVKNKSTFQAKGDEGVYDADAGLVKVYGRASAVKDKTELQADEILYNLATGVMRAVGETRMIIH